LRIVATRKLAEGRRDAGYEALMKLTIVGPKGIAERFATAAEALFPQSTKIERRFEMKFVEYAEGVPVDIGEVRVTPYEVLHPSGAPPYALRLESGGKVLGFSGDSKWVDSLLPAAKNADLFICECFGFDKPEGYHMTWRDIEPNLDRLAAKRVMLTHMNDKMLANRGQVRDPRVLFAEDGLQLDI
jgi:ribonuclease BN (tRNA processing enzyme)